LSFSIIYKKPILQIALLYAQKHINKSMTNTHYEKYSTTIKKVARRNYRKRVAWLNEYLADESCVHCGESETVCLKFYPHDVEIRKQTKRKGMNQESRKDVIELIEKSRIVCSNCWIKLDYDLIDPKYSFLS
tara:strand:+ start:225 stop:620 length:396 start_codon:yes stop_codon:yes gene_type:complete